MNPVAGRFALYALGIVFVLLPTVAFPQRYIVDTIPGAAWSVSDSGEVL